MEKKVEDPSQRCQRCDGTGQIDESYSAGGSYGQKTIARVGECPDCQGSGRKLSEDDSSSASSTA